MGLGWATILAIAFCAIDFAGLARLFTPQKGEDEPAEVWYLMGAWLVGATMNAVMTWWAVSLTLLNHQLGNEILDREQLLRFVPIFVAVLVWLTRILFIGSLTVAGEHMFDLHGTSDQKAKSNAKPKSNTSGSTSNGYGRNTNTNTSRRPRTAGAMSFSGQSSSHYTNEPNEAPRPYGQPQGMYAAPSNPVRQPQSAAPSPANSRIRRRPPTVPGVSRGMPNSGMQAKGK